MRSARAFVPLRHRGFRLLAFGQLTSNVGDLFYTVALPWYVLSRTRRAAARRGARPYGVARTSR